MNCHCLPMMALLLLNAIVVVVLSMEFGTDEHHHNHTTGARKESVPSASTASHGTVPTSDDDEYAASDHILGYDDDDDGEHSPFLRPGGHKNEKKLLRLGSKSVRHSVLSTKSGRHLFSTETLRAKTKSKGQTPSEEEGKDEDENVKKTGILQRFKSALAPMSRQTNELTIKKVEENLRSIALEVMTSQNSEQLHKQKEVLKLALYYEQLLAVFRKEKKKQETFELMAKETSKEMEDAETMDQMLEKETQQNYMNTLRKKREQLTKAKRKIKNQIARLIALAEMSKRFTFATFIQCKMQERHGPPYLSELIEQWEKTKVCQWHTLEMCRWVRKHSTNPRRRKTQHSLHLFANENKEDENLESEVNHLLLVDAAFDREAREKCTEIAFAVPMRNWAAISQSMEPGEIQQYVIFPLKKFHGLHVEFVEEHVSRFTDQMDFPDFDEPKAKKSQKIFKDMWHNFRILVNPYTPWSDKISRCNNAVLGRFLKTAILQVRFFEKNSS